MHSLAAETSEGVSAAIRIQLGTQELRQDRHSQYTRQSGDQPDPRMWRDRLLADIDEHVGELRRKLSRYAMFRSLLSSHPAGSFDEEATDRMCQCQSLRDTAAKALVSEMAYLEAFLREPPTAMQDLRERGLQPKSGATG